MSRQSNHWVLRQTDLFPSCRVFIMRATDTKNAFSIIGQRKQSFAIKSGGSSSVVSVSSIGGVVTLDLSKLDEVTLVDCHQAGWLSPGAQWNEVYKSFEWHGVYTPGRRAGHVGVRGYVPGGRFSWYANQYGWATNDVIQFEVVSPDPQILQVSRHSPPELFNASEGSLSIFGFVTRINMPIVDGCKIHGGAISRQEDQAHALSKTLQDLSNAAATNLASQGYLSVSRNE